MSSAPSICDKFMSRAAEIAARGLGRTRPNPAVGAVVVRDGVVVGEGWHRRAGGDHAEVAAIKDAVRNGAGSLSGAEMFVTLEPCSKPGRVGACTDAIAAAGISRVIYAMPDPNPVNRGGAARALARAGVRCERFRGDKAVSDAARDLVRGFAKRMRTGLPFVTVKIAMSLDGRTHDRHGDSKWISGERARALTSGRLRNRFDAIMVGAETVRRDNPSLLARGRRHDGLLRVVVSRSGNLPSGAKVFTDGRNKTTVCRDAKEAVELLGREGMNEVLCEGGMKLAVSLAELGLVDEWIAVLAPKIIGERRVSDAIVMENVKCLQDW